MRLPNRTYTIAFGAGFGLGLIAMAARLLAGPPGRR